MTTLTRALAVFLMTLSLCSNAVAEGNKKKKPAPKEARTPATTRKSETQKFTGLKLKGQLKKPDLSYIYKRKGLRAEQIVNIPENFNDQILQGENEF